MLAALAAWLVALPDDAARAAPDGGPVAAAAAGGSGKVLWGARIGSEFGAGEAPWDWNAVTGFQRRSTGGKRLSMVHFGSAFEADYCGGHCPFNTADFRTVRAHGAVPFFTWADYGSTNAEIAGGAQDAYIREWATAAKAWGHPFFLRFAWEMNGEWFNWGTGVDGNTSPGYVAMWRHVHDIFRQVGARNVTWVWCPNIDTDHNLYPLPDLYPGDAYVDWTCLDGYNHNDPWRSFKTLFAATYDEITGRIAPSKPMVVGETASTELGGSKARWIADMFAVLPRRFPKIRALLWFEQAVPGYNGTSDWPLSSSPAASAAFAAGIAAPRYAKNRFGRLKARVIRPPR